MSAKRGQPASTSRVRLGSAGEAAAADYLHGLGYEILVKNYRCPAGEIDIIAQDGKTIVICEVKARVDARAGHPFESITPAKQVKLRRAAQHYWEFESDRDRPLRFDIISILGTAGKARLEHLINALD